MIGFLLVRSPECDQPDSSSQPTIYRGIDRVPPYPSDDETERAAVEQYVFGEYKDDDTNLIPTLDSALLLYSLLQPSRYRYEILLCGSDSHVVHGIDLEGLDVEHLGYDVAVVRGDYWSIVGDFSQSDWARPFRNQLNNYGLFSQKEDAVEYLREYQRHGEVDADMLLEVVYLAVVIPSTLLDGAGNRPVLGGNR